MPIMRSPKNIGEYLKEYIKGKVFCDLGCSVGVVLESVKPYVKRAFGIERDPMKVVICKRKGLEVIEGNVLLQIPEADVYYCWITHNINRIICDKIQKGIVVIGAEKFVEEEVVALKELEPDKTITFQFDEGDGHREKGTFYLGLFFK